MGKVCTGCKKSKPLEEYRNETKGRYGKRSKCRSCEKKQRQLDKDKRKEYLQKYYAAKPKAKYISDKKYRENNKEKVSLNKKRWEEENKEHVKDLKRKWKEENKDILKETGKTYREQNRDKIKEAKKDWLKKQSKEWHEKERLRLKVFREDHREEINRKAESRRKKRMETDINFRLKRNMSSRMRNALKAKKAGRKWSSFVSYTTEELKIHLERLFKDGMTWENYGEWHVDHRIPVASFNFENEEEVKECWALTNLQPLWAKDNILKSDKMIYLL